MTRCFPLLILLLLLCNVNSASASKDLKSNPTLEQHLNELVFRVTTIQSRYTYYKNIIHQNISIINSQLQQNKSLKQQVELLIKKDSLKDDLIRISKNELLEINKIRYLKGLEIIKILYEKTLSLDHHFSSVNTINDVNKISNPHFYPEFTNVMDQFKSKKKKSFGFDLSSILEENIYASVIHTFISLFTNNNKQISTEKSLSDVECILDFTLQMHNDLNIIYFETIFLQKSNDNIREELEQLFIDYTKPILYTNSLDICRNTDDWAEIGVLLNKYLDELQVIKNDSSKSGNVKSMLIDLEFSIDRLLQFIARYNAFINQGEIYYEKFGIMLNGYENEQRCSDKIPVEYQKLKESIIIAVEKFKTAYKPIEINGSKLKEVLYGINEYD
ncbi:hypothetical protein ATE92_2262 [Ulvibacter sp. MAR_2010_11]|uniref:hypothetical protein n=1 Tax=Ulvibacter sp. MAR_2010_11 TaxID=1250229 RepID=UPI000C2B5643|nr:hypothetical protein [Ulvibacter sp. MAR_2010_11]PKA84092.1 hypothetical protein ATE92_2262 [Ulvibacter sp. MAR_2010_11]